VKEVLRRFLKPESIRPAGYRVGIDPLNDLWAWMSDFAPSTVAVMREALAHDGGYVFMPAPVLARFKLNPTLCLRLVSEAFEALEWLPSPGRVVWCLNGIQTQGLDEVEAEAVFGHWLALERVETVSLSADEHKLLVVGRLREETVALSFNLNYRPGSRGWKTLACLDLLAATQLSFVLPTAVVFVNSDEAGFLIRHPMHPVTKAIKSGLRDGVFDIGARLNLDGLAPVDHAVQEELFAIRELAAPRNLRHVRCAPLERLIDQPKWLNALGRAGLSYDSSFLANEHGDSPLATSAYVKAGAYWPQPFDPRTPAGVRHDSLPLEIVRISASDRNASSILAWRRGFDEERLCRLLTFERMETYHRDLQPQLAFEHRFHEYRVFNWPRPDPARRITFLDGGGLDRPLRVARLMKMWTRLAKNAALKLRFVGPGFVSDAEQEASARVVGSVNSALSDQIDVHAYLETVPREGPLREDYDAFAGFIGDKLGSVLELGSGYGQLARVLASRACGYTCLDLESAILHDVCERIGCLGVVADIHRLPFANGSFDSVIANNVLEHAYDPVASLVEIRRVLRPGARLLALIPLDALNPRFALRAHWWKADRPSIERALLMAGLVPARVEVINLYELGVRGAFPAQNGLACQFEAMKT
jgi:SAM-dependent methyltransferase